ncbi:TPA: hypothetical protein GRR63_23460 [Vibrio parahaemolyticus]|uniref:hypothetical protein n=1 Tax=Vibrio parahaemolyticus TaxID=670 RepID=UPI0005F272A7|nr:hypothetical protein [Vibrio parahaemolyticus]HAS6475680.1 hypothetical protein [Vibrio parahaemolyticus]
MSEIDWVTVSTSLLTSGGAVFAVYKLWFQRRLEDHKRNLENNSKLFEIEIELLKELGILNVKAQKSVLNIRVQPPAHEAFASKHLEYIDDLNDILEKYSFVLAREHHLKLEKLLETLNSYSSIIEDTVEENRSFEGGKYCVYRNFNEEQVKSSIHAKQEIEKFFRSMQKHIFTSAGRNEI